MATTEAPSFDTATDVLEAIVAGGERLADLKAYLSKHDCKDYRFEVEAWAGVCGGSHDEAQACAFDARMAVIDAYEEVALESALPLWADRMLSELLVGSSHRTSYAAFGDEYIAGMIKLALPPNATVCVPRHLPAYTQAAAVFDKTVNDVVRPLLQTSLKQLLINGDWASGGTTELLIAAVVTLREMIRAPELYVDSEAAAADPAVPSICIRRGVVGGTNTLTGVLHKNKFTVVSRPLDAIALWLTMTRNISEQVDGIMDALEMKDTRSSTAKSILVGRKAFETLREEALENMAS